MVGALEILHTVRSTQAEFCIPQLPGDLVSGEEQNGAIVHVLVDGAYTWYYSLDLPQCWGELRSSLFCFLLSYYSEYPWELDFCVEHNAGSVCTHLGKVSLGQHGSPDCIQMALGG